MRNLIKKTFNTTDNKGCEFRVTLYKTACGWDASGNRQFDVEYVTEVGGGVSAASLSELKEKVSRL